MLVAVTFLAMPMGDAVGTDRHQIDMAEMHAPFGDHRFAELADRPRVATQQCHFHAMAMIEPRAHRRDGEVVMLMLRAVEPQRQIAPVVVIDIGDCRDTLLARVAVARKLSPTRRAPNRESLPSDCYSRVRS